MENGLEAVVPGAVKKGFPALALGGAGNENGGGVVECAGTFTKAGSGCDAAMLNGDGW